MKQSRRISFFCLALASGVVVPSTICISSCQHKKYNSDGTNWQGYESGSLLFSINEDQHTYQIIKSVGYTAHNLVIPDLIYLHNYAYKVVEIGNSAFLNDFSLTGSLTLGKYLVTIGDSAFGDCYYLTSVNLRNVVNILPLAFAHCSYLSGRLIIPPSVEFIGDCAFALCESLLGCENHSIFFKWANAESVGDAKVLLPINHYSTTFDYQSDHVVGSLAFGHLTIPEDTIQIGPDAFLSCANLTGNLVIPDNVVSIGNSAFFSCWYLDGITISQNSKLNSIGSMAFRNCYGFQGTLTITNNETTKKTTINMAAFYRDSNGGDYAERGFTNINFYCDKDKTDLLPGAFEGDGWRSGTLHVKQDSSWTAADFVNQPGLNGWTLVKDL